MTYTSYKILVSIEHYPAKGKCIRSRCKNINIKRKIDNLILRNKYRNICLPWPVRTVGSSMKACMTEMRHSDSRDCEDSAWKVFHIRWIVNKKTKTVTKLQVCYRESNEGG